MTDAPERIWAVHDYVAGMTNILSGHIMLEPTEIAKTTEYVRADLVEAAETKLAADRTELIALIRKDAENGDISHGAAQWVIDTILAAQKGQDDE